MERVGLCSLSLLGQCLWGVDLSPRRKECSLQNWVSYCCGSDWHGAADTTFAQLDSVCTAHSRERERRWASLSLSFRVKDPSVVTCQTGCHLLSGLGEFGPLQRPICVYVLPPLQVLGHRVLDLLRPHPLHVLVETRNTHTASDISVQAAINAV